MNKHDTVIGYIEYLDCNGCVRERIPYVDAEKFKTRIYTSLYCGEPIIPVLFPENLSQPLLFEKGTFFHGDCEERSTSCCRMKSTRQTTVRLRFYGMTTPKAI